MATAPHPRRTLRPPALALFGALLSTLALATPARAQPADGYIGPETTVEPRSAGASRSSRHGGGWSDGGSGGWRPCAEEGRRCRVDGWGVVRYGTDGRYVYREVRNARFRCDNSVFGDPTPGRPKYCDVRLFSEGGWQDGGWQGGGWTFCARENGSCRLPGPATVRYGTDGRFTTESFRGGSVRCDNGTFGDPAPGREKRCEFRAGSWSGGGPGNGWNSGGPGAGWVDCADEDGFCGFRGRRLVWFGADDGRHVVREFRDGVPCTNAAFGGDPAPRMRKRCAVGR